MKILRYNLKKKWYLMIESGEKKEEYREDKEYWFKRLWTADGLPKKFDAVEFVYGYTKRTMMFEFKGISYGTGIEKWGAEPGKKYYITKFGNRIK